jgi:hypothetical protein
MDSGVRFAVLARDGHACRYCGAKAPQHELHVDHVQPGADRANDDLATLSTMCGPCRSGRRLLVVEDAAGLEALSREEYQAALTDLAEQAGEGFRTDLIQGIAGEWEAYTGQLPSFHQTIELGRLLVRFDYRGVRDGLRAYATRQGFEQGAECWHLDRQEPHTEACSAFVAIDLVELDHLLGVWRRDGFV